MVQSDLGGHLADLLRWATSSATNLAISAAAVAALAVLVPFLTNTAQIAIPGPVVAKFTDFWLMLQAIRGNRFEVVHELHKKHGKFVRLAPNHVSIADHRALNPVYGHGTGSLKTEYYDAFVPPKPAVRGLFNTRDRTEHSRKRKIVSHSFAPKSIVAFEPFVRREVQRLLDRFDEFASAAGKGRAELDILQWLNFWAFDTIGDLAFGKPFGMLERGEDEAKVAVEGADGKFTETSCSAIKIINERGEYSASLGLAPVWARSYLKELPWFKRRLASVKKLTGIALSRVNDRLENGSEREDLLAKLQGAKDDRNEPMGKMELTAEALTQLIAGSDTTSNSSCAIINHLCRNPSAMSKLQAELDDALANSEDVPKAAEVQELPYLNAVLNESLRFHSTSAIGLPRILTTDAVVCGKHFPAGTQLSVPSYTVHRDVEVWGQDAEEYNPDRWLREGAKARFDKAFMPFSVGPRACVGRNLALMELQIVIAALVRRYDFVLSKPEEEMGTVEGFLRKPTDLMVGFRRRV